MTGHQARCEKLSRDEKMEQARLDALAKMTAAREARFAKVQVEREKSAQKAEATRKKTALGVLSLEKTRNGNWAANGFRRWWREMADLYSS